MKGDAMNRTIVVSVLTTLAVLLAIVGLGVFAVRAAFAEPGPAFAAAGALWHGHGHGHGMTRACARLDDEHVSSHATDLNRWVSEQLTLDEPQSAALTTLTGTLGDWATDMRPICEMPLDDAPAHVAAVVRATHTTDLALQRFATAFDAFYSTLTPEQRAKLDGWFAHEHGSES